MRQNGVLWICVVIIVIIAPNKTIAHTIEDYLGNWLNTDSSIPDGYFDTDSTQGLNISVKNEWYKTHDATMTSASVIGECFSYKYPCEAKDNCGRMLPCDNYYKIIFFWKNKHSDEITGALLIHDEDNKEEHSVDSYKYIDIEGDYLVARWSAQYPAVKFETNASGEKVSSKSTMQVERFKRIRSDSEKTDDLSGAIDQYSSMINNINYCPEDYMSSAGYDKILFEIDYLSGMKPNPESLKIFSNYIQSVSNKPRGIEVKVGQELTQKQMETVRSGDTLKYRDYYPEGATMTVYVLYDDMPNAPFGRAHLSKSTMFIYADNFNQYKSMLGQRKDVNWAEVEAAIMIHEFGHLIKHISGGCSQPECVLAEASPLKINNILKQVVKNRHFPYKFCPVCLDIFQKYRSGELVSNCMKERVKRKNHQSQR